MSCLKKLHKTTTPTPDRKTPHHPRLVHPGLIYIPLASRVHLPLLLYVRPESSWGFHPEGGRAFKNGQVRPLHSGLSEWPRGRGRRYRNQTGIYTRHTYSWSYILFSDTIYHPKMYSYSKPGHFTWTATLRECGSLANGGKREEESLQWSECTSSPALGKSVPTGACTCKCLVLLAHVDLLQPFTSFDQVAWAWCI